MSFAFEGSQPADTLRAEHRLIEGVLRVLETLVDRCERDGTLNVGLARDCVTFLRLFADRCHHGKEEKLFFPALEALGLPHQGGPIGVLLSEHDLGRMHLTAICDALDGYGRGESEARQRFCTEAGAYIALLTAHIRKEERVLFDIADRLLPPAEGKRLRDSFFEEENRRFDGWTSSELQCLADTIEESCRAEKRP